MDARANHRILIHSRLSENLSVSPTFELFSSLDMELVQSSPYQDRS